jgi:hypothetical protein
MNVEILLSGDLSRPPRELMHLLLTYQQLQREIHNLTIVDLYTLLRAEIKGMNRPTVVKRLQRRLKALLTEQLEAHYEELEATLTEGEDEDE